MTGETQGSIRAENERAIYQAQRAHELETTKATAAFEHAVISPLVLLNGGAIVAFLTLLGAVGQEGSSLTIDIGFALVGIVLWALSLGAAMLAVGYGYQCQRMFAQSVSARRRLMERALPTRPEFQPSLGQVSAESPEDLRKGARAVQERWLLHVRIAQAGFLSGVVAAGIAVVLGVAVPDPEMSVMVGKTIAGLLYGAVVILVAGIVRARAMS